MNERVKKQDMVVYFDKTLLFKFILEMKDSIDRSKQRSQTNIAEIERLKDKIEKTNREMSLLV